MSDAINVEDIPLPGLHRMMSWKSTVKSLEGIYVESAVADLVSRSRRYNMYPVRFEAEVYQLVSSKVSISSHYGMLLVAEDGSAMMVHAKTFREDYLQKFENVRKSYPTDVRQPTKDEPVSLIAIEKARVGKGTVSMRGCCTFSLDRLQKTYATSAALKKTRSCLHFNNLFVDFFNDNAMQRLSIADGAHTVEAAKVLESAEAPPPESFFKRNGGLCVAGRTAAVLVANSLTLTELHERIGSFRFADYEAPEGFRSTLQTAKGLMSVVGVGAAGGLAYKSAKQVDEMASTMKKLHEAVDAADIGDPAAGQSMWDSWMDWFSEQCPEWIDPKKINPPEPLTPDEIRKRLKEQVANAHEEVMWTAAMTRVSVAALTTLGNFVSFVTLAQTLKAEAEQAAEDHKQLEELISGIDALHLKVLESLNEASSVIALCEKAAKSDDINDKFEAMTKNREASSVVADTRGAVIQAIQKLNQLKIRVNGRQQTIASIRNQFIVGSISTGVEAASLLYQFSQLSQAIKDGWVGVLMAGLGVVNMGLSIANATGGVISQNILWSIQRDLLIIEDALERCGQDEKELRETHAILERLHAPLNADVAAFIRKAQAAGIKA